MAPSVAFGYTSSQVESPQGAEIIRNFASGRFVATAQKQRRFHRDTAKDIEWLLKQGRTLGLKANLPGKLEYLWQSSTGDLSEQNDLFRLKFAMETAQNMEWTYNVLSDREWSGRYAVKMNPLTNAILLSESSLEAAFGGNCNQQLQPLLAKITGNVTGMQQLLTRCGWCAESIHGEETQHLFHLKTI
ncbi:MULTISPECIES: DUF2913 family protein [Enterobacterales]|uniref:DUF2913 family protein n=1 Tax=Enterobacterales TaxID=91347 RepID=UPI002EDB1C5D